ncbi:FAD-dependent oxidoreductase [Actinokineospora iranica]|uniref:Predicted flavoprotein CzcO associated with the cation diffusion facilitator CzcD n=1 Tax=Actinokineospora iranica TaxID=1271860 RepID=A0A1G6MVF4_9PSEU|nr:FAD-dependent oxidoreductase [Actinokineospora iranica]SDC58956.1 Predicted flavoprotein CzcO associated with the cation diffusion facilitator CzcD [Actinokineospora iranica]
MDVVVIGAGQAGLSSAYFLRRTGLDFVVLDANPGPGGAWRHRWPSLRLGTVHGIHPLPESTVPSADPDRPASEVVAEYFGGYERAFDLPVRRPVAVRAVRESSDRLLVETDSGTWSTRAVINATGTWDRPFWPHYPGRFDGRQVHTANYRGPEEFAGQRVVVVGGGASGVQSLIEIAEVAASTTWVTRRPPVWREGPFTPEVGRAAVARVADAVREGRIPASVVSVTGLGLTPEVIEARGKGILDRLPMFDRLIPTGVAWNDGRTIDADAILWATGFRHALDHLAPLRLRGPGGGIVMDGTRVAADPRIHLVGYGPSASTIGATRAGQAAAASLKRLLKSGEQNEIGTLRHATVA